jgi:hypothetical protein
MGAAVGGTLALALLVFGCVFAAMAGPAISLRLRTEALQQALTRLGPQGTSIDVTASSNLFAEDFSAQPILTEDDLSAATSALASGFAASVPLAAGSWAGLTTTPRAVLSGSARMPAGYHPELEVTYREQLTSNVQVIAGQVADANIPPGVLGVAVTPQTAARFGLRPGSRLTLKGPAGPVDVLVTAIVRPRQPASTFWVTDPAVTAPDLVQNLATGQVGVLAGALADPGELAAVQSAFCPSASKGCDPMRLEWEFPVAVSQVNADRLRRS